MNIVVVGSLNMDLVVRMPKIPRPGETLLGEIFRTFPGGKGDLIVVGFDGSPEVVDSILAGEIDATVLQPCTRGAEMAVEQADQYIKTGSTGLDEKQLVDCELVTPENADCIENFANVC